MKYLFRTLILAITLSCFGSLNAQHLDKDLKSFCIGFYNVENLFDTINQPGVIDEEFTPTGLNRWDTDKYERKLQNMSFVISILGGAPGPDVIGLAEVENRGVLEDLIKMPSLVDKNYGIVHYDSSDPRGVDCAFLYKKDRFQVTRSAARPVVIPEEPHTSAREIVHMEGIHDGETFHFLVAHWKSRSGGEKASMHRRMASARIMRFMVDSILSVDNNAKIFLMGDFNDDPTSPSVIKGLQAKPKVKNLHQPEDLFSPMYALYKDGFGTLAYRDSWNLFDIMIANTNAVKGVGKDNEYKLYRHPKNGYYAFIMNASFLTQAQGKYKGYPLRTIVGGQYQGGYSDHFPVYMYMVKKDK